MKHENYVLHYRNLKFIVDLGAVVTLRRVISFKQSRWMAGYINGNNELRAKAKAESNKFLDELFKLMNNSVFGKTMEDVRKRKHGINDRQREGNKMVQSRRFQTIYFYRWLVLNPNAQNRNGIR